MLIDGVLRKRHRRDQVTLEVGAAEPAPMGVAGPKVSQAVIEALRDRALPIIRITLSLVSTRTPIVSSSPTTRTSPMTS